jgi:hypothetical protein
MPSTMATLSHKKIPPKIYSVLDSFSAWDCRYFETKSLISTLS